VNQIELSPWRNCSGITAACRAMGIVVQAYSPLTKGRKLADSRLAAVAAKYSKTPAQILIRYGIDQVYFVIASAWQPITTNFAIHKQAPQGFVTLPKSVTPSRIESNFAVFDFKISPGFLFWKMSIDVDALLLLC
jgi:diketogulonate reductase-like aldo/keto reductase